MGQCQGALFLYRYASFFLSFYRFSSFRTTS